MDLLPDPPIHWDTLRAAARLDPDTWHETRAVLEGLLAMPAFPILPPEDRAAVWLACLLHRLGKPGDDRKVRRLLWELGVPFGVREQACGLVRFRGIPRSLVDRQDAQRLVCELSLSCRAELLALVDEAEARANGLPVDDIGLFLLFCEEQGCASGPRPFPSDHTRVTYFRSRSRSPDLLAHDETRAELILMSGLPGAGKDTWVQANVPELPMVSLDALRTELGVAPDADQGTVQQAGRARLREHLRRGAPFVYVATNLDRQRRAPVLGLAADYGYRVRIVYVEVPYDTLFAQNQGREASVPERIIGRMADRWEVPGLTEAHRVDAVVR